jgi:hypothetical protein
MEICIKYAKPAPGTVFARDLLVTGITGSLLTKRNRPPTAGLLDKK